MFRWITNDYDAPEKKHLPSLILSGLFFGIGVCCKWQCLYAGAGLAIIYSIYLIKRCLWRKRNGIPYAKELFDILLISLLFFIIVPVILYSLCYIPYAVGGQNFSLDIVIDNQKYMFNYHSGVTATHSYGSRWWQWILDLRPILYYLQTPQDGYRSSFAAFGNPVLYWGGLLALICIAVRFFRHRDGRIAFIIIGWAAQILPWIFISRVSFAYHYFPAELFLVLALCWVANDWTERDKFGSRLMFISLPTASIILFVLFYPVLSGVADLKKFSYNVLKWFPSWPF